LLAGQPLLEVYADDRFQVEYSICLPLHEGAYTIQVAITEPIIPDQTANYIDYIEDAIVFSISRWKRSVFWSNVYLFPSVEINSIS
jgi:lipopolysaccharide transport system ATP-binding protein